MKSLSIEDQIAQRLADLDNVGIEVVAPTVAPEEIIEPEQEPEVAVEPLTIKTTPIKIVKDKPETIIFNWVKTRLHLVLVQDNVSNVEQIVLGEFSGTTVRMDKPFSNIGDTEHQTAGYLNKYFKPFIKALKSVTKPDSVRSVGTVGESGELYSKMAIAILEHVYRVLPRSDDNRLNILASISTEVNSFTDDTVIDFYVVYRTDYDATELLSKIGNDGLMQRSVNKGDIVDVGFSLIITAVFPLSKLPDDVKTWKENGFTKQDYANTRMLPSDRDDKSSILGTVPETKRPMPSIVLSKVFEAQPKTK